MTALWDRASEAGRSAGGAFWRGLSEADSRVAELESLRARVSELEWENKALRAEFAKHTGVNIDTRGSGADER